MIYLDNSATTRPAPEVVDVVNECLTVGWGNPSSPHHFGLRAEERLEQARRQVAASLSAQPEEIIFTSGGTEANNLALKGLAAKWPRSKRPAQIVVSAIEHPSILEPARQLAGAGWTLRLVPVDRDGLIDLNVLERVLRERTALVSVMAVNNEVGTVQPIQQIAELIIRLQPEAKLHVDAVQAFGKLPLNMRQFPVDALTVSGHKIHAPQGIGALYLREGVSIEPLLSGGAQETNRRSGTENVAGAAALGRAAELFATDVERTAAKLQHLSEQFWNGLQKQIPGVLRNGDATGRNAAPHIVNVSFPGLPGEVMVRAMAEAGVYASMASACSTRNNKRSHVLSAMFPNDDSRIDSAVRFSFSYDTNEAELQQAIGIIREVYSNLTKTKG